MFILTGEAGQGGLKMGNIVSRVETKPISLAFQASVQTITPHRFPDVTMLHTPTCLCGSLPDGMMQTTTISYLFNKERTG